MKINTIGPVIGCFASSLLMVPNSFADGYFGAVSAEVVHSDNGNKSPDNKISELQEQYNINLGASYENYIGKFEADYGASYRGFSEDSQPNKSTLEGHSALQLGHQSQIAELLIEHSRQTLLNKADSLDLTGNQDERDLLSISPTFNWHFSSADILFLKGNYSDIHYLETELNNSTRAGATLGALHQITEVDSVGLNLQSTKVDFEYFPTSNYTLRAAMLSYAAQLRQLSYRVQAGGNQSETESGEKYTMPSYVASLSFKSGVNTFVLNIAQELTDTSFGSGNKNIPEGPPSSDGGINQSSQINRKRADAQWTTTALCDRCTVIMNAYSTRDNYISVDKDATEVGVSIVGDYALSHAAMISLRLTQSEHSFPDKTLGENYKFGIATLEYSYRLGKNCHIKGSYSSEKRVDDNPATSYLEKLIGLSVSYSF